jgi:transcriptional regulator with XRE-family HTH domain
MGMKAIDKIGSAFLRRILRRMKELGISQSELAERIFSWSYELELENG